MGIELLKKYLIPDKAGYCIVRIKSKEQLQVEGVYDGVHSLYAIKSIATISTEWSGFHDLPKEVLGTVQQVRNISFKGNACTLRFDPYATRRTIPQENWWWISLAAIDLTYFKPAKPVIKMLDWKGVSDVSSK